MESTMKHPSLPTLLVTLLILVMLSAMPSRAHDTGAMADGAATGTAKAGAMAQMGAHMTMGPHMVMTDSRPVRPEDTERAKDLLETLRSSIGKYKNYKVALANRYVPFLPTIPQNVYHFVNYSDSYQEYTGHFNATHPGSLLYVKKGADDYVLVGAMYSAPPETTPDELDKLIPLSVGHWHAHVNICLPNGFTLDDMLRGDVGADKTFTNGMIPVSASPHAMRLNHQLGFLADGRFGFTGKIDDASSCTAAGGYFIPQAFGWMIHVYPFAGDDLKVAYGQDVPPVTVSAR
jgi:hypothetical protein